MVEFPACRSWSGVRDSVHPLSRAAHSAVAHGRYIYVLNGYAPTENGRVIFDRAGLTRYDTLTNMVTFLPIHWDPESLVRFAFVDASLVVAGNSAAVCTDPVSSRTSIYTFAGFSLLTNIHVNALIRLDLGSPDSCNLTRLSANSKTLQIRPSCCRASVLSGHGILSALVSLPPDNPIFHAIGLACLRTLKHRMEQVSPHQITLVQQNHLANPNLQPSPRDKLCMEYWKGRLFAFGGYGPNFKPPLTWPIHFVQWPFLFDPNSPDQWVLCNDDNGWNNQLLVFDLSSSQWSLVSQSQMVGQPPIPRAAHRSTLLPDRGWMFVFGGRGPYSLTSLNTANPGSLPRSNSLTDFSMGRLNDLYCLNLNLFEWTRVITPMDVPNPRLGMGSIWPCGRSWMDISILPDSNQTYSSSSWLTSGKCLLDQLDPSSPDAAVHLFLLGGWSNTEEPLNDAYLLRLNYCSEHSRLEAKTVACTHHLFASTGSDKFKSESPIKPCLLKNPSIVNGFRCSARCIKNPFSTLVLTSDGISPVFTEILEPDWELSDHISTYQQASFTAALSGTANRLVHPTEPFYQISKLHCSLTQFLVNHYARIDMNNESSDHVPEVSNLLKELDDLCTVLMVLLQPSGPIISKLLRLFLKSLPPWSILQMLVTETNAWVSQSDQQSLLTKLTSDRLYPLVTKTASGDFVKLDFADQAVIDKFMLLLTPNKVHIPEPFQNYDQLTSFTHQVVASIFTWSGRSPLVSCTDDLGALPNPALAFHLDPFLNPDPNLDPTLTQPLTRFWHTVTSSSNGCIYAIGGTNRDASQIAIEAFRLFGPPTLNQICLEQTTRFVLPGLLERVIQLQNSRRTLIHDCRTNKLFNGCSASGPSLPQEEEEQCVKQLLNELDNLLTEPVKRQLLQLLI